MSYKSSIFTIKEEELASALEINRKRLDEIVDFFNFDPNDEWELREDDHFVYINKTLNERIFSQHGAFAIAKYMDSIEEKTLWNRIVEFVTKHKEKIRNAFIRQKILDNSSSLTLRNNRHFLSKKDVVNILCTSYARLNKAFEDIQKSNSPMTIYEDFDDIDGVRYYSLSGFYKLAQLLSNALKKIDRREWCSSIDIVGKKTFKLLIDAQTAEEKRIKSAMDSAKTRDRSRCRITGQKREKYHEIYIVGHHIFSKEHYSHLAACRENLITLAEGVHNEFHSWNGGTQNPCTIDHLIQFINERYPDKDEISVELKQIKHMLGEQKVSQ